MYERGYSDYFLSFFEIAEYLIMNGHNTEFRNPYNYSLKTIIMKSKMISKIEDRKRALEAQIQLTTNITSGGFGGKDSMKHFKEMIKNLNGD